MRKDKRTAYLPCLRIRSRLRYELLLISAEPLLSKVGQLSDRYNYDNNNLIQFNLII